jgi:hypothetical protein
MDVISAWKDKRRVWGYFVEGTGSILSLTMSQILEGTGQDRIK